MIHPIPFKSYYITKSNIDTNMSIEHVRLEWKVIGFKSQLYSYLRGDKKKKVIAGTQAMGEKCNESISWDIKDSHAYYGSTYGSDKCL